MFIESRVYTRASAGAEPSAAELLSEDDASVLAQSEVVPCGLCGTPMVRGWLRWVRGRASFRCVGCRPASCVLAPMSVAQLRRSWNEEGAVE